MKLVVTSLFDDNFPVWLHMHIHTCSVLIENVCSNKNTSTQCICNTSNVVKVA